MRLNIVTNKSVVNEIENFFMIRSILFLISITLPSLACVINKIRPRRGLQSTEKSRLLD